MKVLIVEDETGMTTVLKMFLEPIASEITIAKDMEQALKEISGARDIEIITLDLGLPDSPVSVTVDKIKEIRRYRPSCLIIVVTGMDYPDLEAVAKANGADEVVRKSAETFTGPGFLKLIGKIANKHLSQPQNFQHSVSVFEKVMEKLRSLNEGNSNRPACAHI